MWISFGGWSVLACLSSGEAWKLFSRASVKGLLLCSGTFVHGGISEDRGLDSSPASPHGNPAEDIERAIASEWTRVEDTYGLERPLHGESLVYIHRQTTQRMLLLFEKDGCLISKAVQKICLLSKQISACVLAKCV